MFQACAGNLPSAALDPGRLYWKAGLLVVVVAAGAQSDQASSNLPSGKYRHIDHVTNKELLCDKCPAGTHVAKHCMESVLRECSPCPSGTFTKHENGIERCHVCREPCRPPKLERTPCTALSDRECNCPPGTFLSNDTCAPHAVCQAGWGVKKRGSETEDTRCKPCPRGTFSDVPSSVVMCKSHTDCLGQGLVKIKAGTKKSDNVCGPVQSLSGTDTDSTEPSDAHDPSALNTSPKAVSSGLRFAASTRKGVTNPTRHLNETSHNDTHEINMTASSPRATKHQQNHHYKNHSQVTAIKMQPVIGIAGAEGEKHAVPKAIRRGPPRPNAHKHFDINEHLPWMIVLFLLLVLVVIVVCSIRRSSRVLKKGPRQDPNTIVEKAAMMKSTAPPQNREKWIYYCNGHGIDILKLVAAQVGSQWQDIYLQLCNSNEHEVAAFSNGYSADHERAYAALQHWTVGPEASLAKLIGALRQHRRIDVVEKIRGLMEDTSQLEVEKLSLPVNAMPGSSGIVSHKPSDSTILTIERSPLEKNKGFFVDESEPLLRCDSTSSGSSALSRTGSFITKEKKDTVLRQVRLDPCDLQPIFDDMLHILNPDELHVIEEIPHAEDKLDRLFEIAGAKSQDASQKLLDSVYCHLPDLL
uniref:Tumor necrosis factor receptor superfamily member 21 isoform X2 n=1 Tax=Geotrypetes seraphini TaxID=260995 RepID=A0A6P8QBH8_GEOSA|nr:tumor necrosis factor receptor superfamily member 21 isoform X2 [Geotrypetes seraphini]